MSELRPCPFCGGEPERHTTARNRRHSVGCKGCNIYFMGPEEYKAAAAWNQRTTPPREDVRERDDVFSDLEWGPTLYPQIETAWSEEDKAFLARWKEHPHSGMADGPDRHAAVASLIEVTNEILSIVQPTEPAEKPIYTAKDLQQAVEDTTRHNCEHWRMEGIGCADCNPIARELATDNGPGEVMQDLTTPTK